MSPSSLTKILAVKQSFIIVPFSAALPTTLAILRQDLADHTPRGANPAHSTSKCMVFFPTTRHVSFAQELLTI
jgi:ATP-dependent RNA helicase MSS116